MFRRVWLAAMGGLCAFTMCSMLAVAQQMEVESSPEETGQEAVAPEPALPLAAGPKVHLADINGKLGTLDLGNGAVHVIGNMGKFMTDIAFCPGGTLYGIYNFNKLYRINPANATKTLIGSTGATLNALVCSSAGVLLAMGPNVTNLYRVNRNTGQATIVGPTGFKSGGDLAFHEGKLYLTSTVNKLVRLNPANGAVISIFAYNIADMWGLISTGTNKLYGFAFNKAYKFTENAQGPNGATTVVFNFANKGLAKTAGASFNGSF